MIRRGRVLVAMVAAAAGCGDARSDQQQAAIGASEDRLVVEVLNAASPRAGLARVATQVLRGAGIDVVFYGTADTTVDSTVVLVRRGDVRQGQRVARALGSGRVMLVPDTLPRVDVTVWVGREWKVPKGVLIP